MSLLSVIAQLAEKNQGTGILTPAPEIDLSTMLYISEGNSIGWGSTSTNPTTDNFGYVIAQSLKAVNPNLQYVRMATSGAQIDAMQARLNTMLANIQPAHTKVVISLIEGTNTLSSGVSGAGCYAQMMTLAQDILNFDTRCKVVIYPCIAATTTARGGDFESKRVTYNNLIYGTPVTDRLKWVDFRDEPRLNTTLGATNLTYYSDDGVHLTTLGYAILAELGLPIIEDISVYSN